MGQVKIDIKFIFNILSLLGAVAWGWYQMELRIATLEMKIANYEKVSQLRDEINLLKGKNG
tara:strand:+ start:574 stop:756 length:183 start_codon:yes stop_codon:yes gene_type:complete